VVAYLYLFLFGIIVGSFYNVCIYRLPEDQDIFLKRSFCRKCKQPIKWYHNIPLLGYLALLGKCSNCKKKISFQYPLVELITGLLFVYAYSLNGLSFFTGIIILFYSALLIIFFTDFNEYLILDVITLPLTALGIAISFFKQNPFEIGIIESLVGSAVGFSILYLIRWFYLKYRNIEGMGLGDAKLLLFLGSWLGIKSILFILLVSSISALIVAIPIVLITKNSKFPVPYGCFIVFSSIMYPLFGDTFYKLLS
jgi:leader peptidase (prepilin peptidase)/N-methyltransferase